MGKKIDFSSPLGIAITVAGLILVLSPQARSALRRFMVKGTATTLDTMQHVGGITAGVLGKDSHGGGSQDLSNTKLEVKTAIEPVADPENTPKQTPEINGN
ncbi:hypothetical protein [Alicyclobacillus kakegawensis]|uniref:hypothetical protein n=1 Tax=Alicyclobacillus kakegawensis TaxID=392012 RepID=UPI000835506A|nr:hypothetical protein [Alicyclobacillus kakegawensis]